MLVLLTAIVWNVAAQNPEQSAGINRQHHLMPVPMSVRFLSGRLPVDASFTVALKGQPDTRMYRGVERAVRRLQNRTGLEISQGLSDAPANASLVIEYRATGDVVPSLNEDETYSLEVSPERALLSAPTVVGALRGLETLLQLLEGDSNGYFIPVVHIEDKPRFPWRGLLIDVCRHWEPIEVIKRNLDGMAAVKLNVLHLHLTEDQGFRIESRKYPKLHEQGSDGKYYTQDQIRDLVAYARDRGIRIMPEFDIPGHTTAWFVGHPEIASAPGPYQIERKYGVFDPSMDPTREETYKFLDKFLGEMAALFPDAYMHIGGDEVTGKPWRLSPEIQAFIEKKGLKDKHGLQAYFNQRILKILQKHKKKMVGWDEILHPDLPTDIVVQSWRGQKSLAEGAKKGYTGILSSGYYLDHLITAAQHYAVDPIRADTELTEQEQSRILGGEACMWGEYVSPENVDSRIWPRLAAIAERFWSPRGVTDIPDMYRRLEFVSVELEDLGLTHLSYDDRMLRRIAGTESIQPLKTLVDVVEPLKNLGRSRVHPITQMSPLTRLVDVAGADSRIARRYGMLVDGLLNDAPRFSANRDGLLNMLNEWRSVYPAIYVAADRAPIVREAEPLAKQLSDMSAAGLEALEFLSKGVAVPHGWREEKMALLDKVKANRSEVEFAILPSTKLLVLAAAEALHVHDMSLAAWKARITTMAAEKRK